MGFINPVRFHELMEIFGHGRVVLMRQMRGAPVVALVDEVDGELPGKLFAQRLPVIQRSEQAVEDNQRKPFPHHFVIEMHTVRNVVIAKVTQRPQEKLASGKSPRSGFSPLPSKPTGRNRANSSSLYQPNSLVFWITSRWRRLW